MLCLKNTEDTFQLNYQVEGPFYDGKNVVSLNAGRYAIVYAIEDAGWKQIWLPYYLCNTVADSIRICLPQVKIDYYHINEQLLPDLPFLSDDEGLLWVNYFGVQPESVIDQMVQLLWFPSAD